MQFDGHGQTQEPTFLSSSWSVVASYSSTISTPMSSQVVWTFLRPQDIIHVDLPPGRYCIHTETGSHESMQARATCQCRRMACPSMQTGRNKDTKMSASTRGKSKTCNFNQYGRRHGVPEYQHHGTTQVLMMTMASITNHATLKCFAQENHQWHTLIVHHCRFVMEDVHEITHFPYHLCKNARRGSRRCLFFAALR